MGSLSERELIMMRLPSILTSVGLVLMLLGGCAAGPASIPESARFVGGGTQVRFTPAVSGTLFVVDVKNDVLVASQEVHGGREVIFSAEELESATGLPEEVINWRHLRLYFQPHRIKKGRKERSE